VKRIGLILLAIVAIAFIMPAAMAQTSSQFVNINGYVYSGALPMGGAKVQIYSWDGKNMGNAPLKTVTSNDASTGTGSFSFKNVPYDSSKTFNYVVRAEKDDQIAFALVHIVPAEKSGETPKVEPIVMDFAMDSWVTDLTGTVQSGNLLANAIGVPGANVTIYERNQTDGSLLTTIAATAVTDINGKFEVKNLPYGLYQAVILAKVSNNNYVEKVNFTVYQQETHINAIMSQILLATPTPTATPKPSGSGGGFFGIPGFEVVLALAALSGTALFLRKR
jgi:PGF-CTERM protein